MYMFLVFSQVYSSVYTEARGECWVSCSGVPRHHWPSCSFDTWSLTESGTRLTVRKPLQSPVSTCHRVEVIMAHYDNQCLRRMLRIFNTGSSACTVRDLAHGTIFLVPCFSFFFKNFILFYFMCMDTFPGCILCMTCVWLWWPEESVESPRAGVTDTCELPWCSGNNPGPLVEKSLL